MSIKDRIERQVLKVVLIVAVGSLFLALAPGIERFYRWADRR